MSKLAEQLVEAIIKKEGSKWGLYSHTGKHLGTFDSEEEAKKREKQVNWFKYQDKQKSKGDDTYHNRFAPDRKHNKGDKKFKPLEKKCAKCGTKSGQLDIDHKDGNRKNNNRSNLRYMCRSCHRKMHAKRNGGKGTMENYVDILVKGTVFDPTDSDQAKAGDQNKDLMHVKFELCHTGANKNHDGFVNEEMKQGHETARKKPLNWEHTTENIGVIYDTEYVEKDNEATIIAKAAVWKHKHPERARVVSERYADSGLFFSMETYFQSAKCSVCEETFSSSLDYCDHLNNRMQVNAGTTRWLLGLNFVGAGVVRNPADVKSVGLAIASRQHNFGMLAKAIGHFKLDPSISDWVKFLQMRGGNTSAEEN
jgi:5-methylcytosine-specific restriction endonuclease McrA